MSDLAYNINGESFELPTGAQSWRVRRMKPRGAPEVVYGREGVPLIIPIESDVDELRRNVDAPGRFRLDAVDERGRTIPDVPAAYVQVASVIETATDVAVLPSAHAPARDAAPSGVISEAMRLNTELAKSVIDRFPEMMHAAAELLRAADGAGLPARAPRVTEPQDEGDDDDDDEDMAPAKAGSTGFDLLVAAASQLVPMVVSSVMGGGKMPDLGSMFDWRKAAAAGAAKRAAREAATAATVEPSATARSERALAPPPAGSGASTTEPATGASTTDHPPLDPAAMVHFLAIQRALSPEEAQLARALAAELTPQEMRAWLAELTALSVPDAVAKIRAALGATSQTGAAS